MAKLRTVGLQVAILVLAYYPQICSTFVLRSPHAVPHRSSRTQPLVSRFSVPPENAPATTAERVKELVKTVFDNSREKYSHRTCSALPKVAAPLAPTDGGFIFPTADMEILEESLISNIDSVDAQHMFVKSDIGTGKSTMARLLAMASPDIVVSVSYSGATDNPEQAIFDELNCESLKDMRQELEGKMLIIDECHIAFSSDMLLTELIKKPIPDFFLLMISSSQAHQQRQDGTVSLPSPVYVTTKKFIDFLFTKEDVGTLVEANNPSEQYDVDCREDQKKRFSVVVTEMLWQLFLGHRLLTVFALGLLIEETYKEVTNPNTPDYVDRLIGRNLRQRVFVAETFRSECRSARINSNFDTLYYGHVVCLKLLCDGPFIPKRGREEQAAGAMITRGAMKPTQRDSRVYQWTNPFVARYFHESIANEDLKVAPVVLKKDPISLVLLALAWFEPEAFFGDDASNNPGESLQFLQMPYESRFQKGLASGWDIFSNVVLATPEAAFVDGEWVDGTGSMPQEGRVDFMLKTSEDDLVFIELAVFGMALDTARTDNQKKICKTNDCTIEDHISTFFTGKKAGSDRLSYTQAMSDGQVVVVIFSHIDVVDSAVEKARSAFQNSINAENASKLTVLVLGMHSIFRYEVVTLEVNSNLDDIQVCRPKDTYDSTLCAMRVEDGQLVVNQRQPTVMEQMDRYGHPLAVVKDGPVVDEFDDIVQRTSLAMQSSFKDLLRQQTLSVWCKDTATKQHHRVYLNGQGIIEDLKDAIAKFCSCSSRGLQIYAPCGGECVEDDRVKSTLRANPYLYTTPPAPSQDSE